MRRVCAIVAHPAGCRKAPGAKEVPNSGGDTLGNLALAAARGLRVY